jgi:hypothetical protein
VLGSTTDGIGQDVMSAALVGDRAYLATHDAGLLAYDLSDVGAFRLFQTVGPPFARDLLHLHGYLLTVRWGLPHGERYGSYGLWSYANGGAAGPRLVDRFRPYDGDLFAGLELLAASDGWVYTMQEDRGSRTTAPGGLYAVDARDPTRLALSAKAPLPGGVLDWQTHGLAAADGLVVLTTRRTIYVYRHLRP